MQHSLQSTTTLALSQKSNFCFWKTYGMAFYSFLIKSPFATAAKKLTRRNSVYYGVLACFFMLASVAYHGNAGSVTANFAPFPPTITSFTPKQAKPGDVVTLTGTNFNTTAADNIVFFGATRATVTAATATSLTVTVPTGATYAPITLLNTVTSLACYSLQNFTPTYSPAKTTIGAGSFATKIDFATGSSPASVAIGDLDGDGKADLVVANYSSNSVSVYRSTAVSGSVGSGSFAVKVDFPTGSNPNFVAIGDLDGDGRPDLAAVNAISNSVSVLRNTSTSGSISSGSFAPKEDFATGSKPMGLAIGDLDRDGKPDLVIANKNSNNVSVLRNTSTSGSISSGSFAVKVDFPTGLTPYSVAIGDLDGDGKGDLVVASENTGNVSVLRNTSISGSFSSDSFATKVDFSTGSDHYSVAIGDLDGDGKPDLVLPNFSLNSVSVLQNTSNSGSINFAAKQDFATGNYPVSVAISDFDGDGKADLAVANFGSNSVSIYHNISTNGSIGVGSFATKVDFATGLYPNFLAIGDLDGDSKPDLVLTNQNGNSVSILRNADLLPPTITSFTPKQSKPGEAVTLTGTNFNAAAANNIVFFGATRATVTAATATSLTVTVPTGATYAPITLLNTGTSLAAYSLRNFTPTYSPARTTMGTGSFATKADFETGTQPYSVAIGDLDGDGKPDMAIANAGANTVSVYRNISTSADISTGSFATKVDFQTGSAPYSVAIGDLDGDGKPDLAVANMNSSSVSVLRNTNSGRIDADSFATKVDFTTGGWPHSVAIGDLDGDGKPDLAIANRYSNDISVLRNTATTGNIVATSFAIKVDFATGTAPVSVAIGDLDGDGKPDLAVANSMSLNASIFRNTSTRGSIDASSFAAKVDFTTGKAPSSVVIGDLDGDGNPDLVVTNANSSSVSVFRNTATSGDISAASFAMKVDFPTSSVPFSVAIGDLDGDGKPDLAVANANSSSVSVFRNTTSGNISAASFATKMDLTTGSYPYSVAIGDLDGDGIPDLAVANYDSNNVSVIHNADLLPPTITSFTPKQSKPGDVVTLTGTNFNAIAANNIVFFGAMQATVTAATKTSLTVTVPTGATNSVISVLNTGTNLIAYSQNNFTPIFKPVKSSIVAIDFVSKVDFTTGTNPGYVTMGDLDGDGLPDMVATNQADHTVSVFLNTGSRGNPSFATGITLTTGQAPQGVALGDIDGDGKLDMAITSYNGNVVSVFRNTSTSGNMSFAAKVDIALGSCPFFVVIRDVDGDGRADLVTANKDANTVSIVLNTGGVGAISFAARVDLAAGIKPYSVIVGDLDGDGKPDVAASAYGENIMVVFRNTSNVGLVSFDARQDFAVTTPYSISIGDLDGDGKSDLVTGNLSSANISIFINTSVLGTISFAAKSEIAIGQRIYNVAIGDLDGDGKNDLVTSNYTNNTVSILRNTGTSGSTNFATQLDLPSGAGPNYVAIADVDLDDKPDLLVTNYDDNTVSVIRNNPIAIPTITSFTPLQAKTGDAITITGANFNTTAANNIIFFGATQATVTAATATSLTVTVPTGATYAPITLLNTGNSLACYSLSNFSPTYSPTKTTIDAGSFAAKQDFNTHNAPYSVTIGDLDGDGKPDLVVANQRRNDVSVYHNTSTNGHASYAAKVDFEVGVTPYSVAIGDLDGDGKPDLAVADYSSDHVSVLRNTSTSGSIGSGSFAEAVHFPTGDGSKSVAIGDLDGDGKPDLAVANNNSNNVSVLRNTSTSGSITSSSFATKVDFPTGDGPESVAIGDLDGDGKADLAVANGSSNSVSVLRNKSTIGSIVSGSFAVKADFATGNSPNSVAIGDLDGDGKSDLVVSNQGSFSVSVLRNTSTSGSIGSGSFADKVDFTAGDTPMSVAIGDLDGDGKPDLAVANYYSHDVSVLRNTSTSGSIGSGSFAAKVDFTTGYSPKSVAIGDLDGDGKADLAVTNLGGPSVSVLRNSTIDADLSALTLSNGTLSPSFASGTIAYTATVSNSTTSITVTPTQVDANASIQVQVNNGGYATVASGSASGALALNVGSNTIGVKVTAEDPNVVKTYTVTVTRAKANQTIAFPNFSAKNTTSPDFEPGATTDSGLALTYTSSNTSVATVYQDNTDGDKWKIHIQGEGTTDIVAAQAGNSNYNSASASRQLIVGNVLPVELTNYEAKIQNNKEVLLSWVTSSELNNAGFEIWKSTDGKAFENLTFVKGVGSGVTNQRYSYVDLSPNTGNNYYKLIQLDKDGVSKEIGLKSVRFEISKQDIVSIYPNPTSNFVNIDFEASKFTSISVSDVSGKVILKRKISSTESKVSLNVEKLPTASYIIKLQGAKGSVAKTFIKL